MLVTSCKKKRKSADLFPRMHVRSKYVAESKGGGGGKRRCIFCCCVCVCLSLESCTELRVAARDDHREVRRGEERGAARRGMGGGGWTFGVNLNSFRQTEFTACSGIAGIYRACERCRAAGVHRCRR